jgi:hypothetical protein
MFVMVITYIKGFDRAIFVRFSLRHSELPGRMLLAQSLPTSMPFSASQHVKLFVPVFVSVKPIASHRVRGCRVPRRTPTGGSSSLM